MHGYLYYIWYKVYKKRLRKKAYSRKQQVLCMNIKKFYLIDQNDIDVIPLDEIFQAFLKIN